MQQLSKTLTKEQPLMRTKSFARYYAPHNTSNSTCTGVSSPSFPGLRRAYLQLIRYIVKTFDIRRQIISNDQVVSPR